MHLKGIENIVSRILGDAEISAGRSKLRPMPRWSRCWPRPTPKAEQVYAQGLKSAKAEVENVLLRGKSMADLEGRKALLAARQTVVDEAFEEAEKALEAKRKDKDYVKLLSKALPSLWWKRTALSCWTRRTSTPWAQR